MWLSSVKNSEEKEREDRFLTKKSNPAGEMSYFQVTQVETSDVFNGDQEDVSAGVGQVQFGAMGFSGIKIRMESRSEAVVGSGRD